METTMQALRSNVAARLMNYRREKRIVDEYTWGFLSLLEFTAEDVGDHRTKEQAYRIGLKLRMKG